PPIVTATISSKTGACACMPDSIPLRYIGASVWGIPNAGVPRCPNPSGWTLHCDQGAWLFSGTNLGVNLHPNSESCDPFALSFVNLDGSGICGGPGSFTITITE